MRSRFNGLLVGVVLLSAVLRLYQISKLPPGFTPDEAAFGYNAYSILKTGKDEWGTPWWQLFYSNLRSFGDYKLPVYTFLTMPSVALLGLTETAVRMPNAIMGTLAVIAVYLLATKLFSARIGLISATVLAISPWSVQLSRGGFEANLATLLVPLLLYLLLSKRYLLAAACGVLAFYAYHSTRLLVVPVVLLTYLLDKQAVRNKLFWLVFVVGILPGLVGMFMGPASRRASDVAIFSPTGGWSGVSADRFDARINGLPDPVARLFYNKATYTVSQLINSYLPYLSPQFLAVNGPGEGTYGMLPGIGVIYLLELVFLAGFVVLKIKKTSPALQLVSLGLLLAIFPAAIAKGPGGAANRAAAMMPFLVMAIASGLEYWIQVTGKRKKIIGAIFGLAYLVSLTFFVERYYFHAEKTIGQAMLVGMQETVSRVTGLAQNYSQVQISRSLSEPHIYVAFYSQYDPDEYQKAAQSWTSFEEKGYRFLDQLDGYTLGKYRFGGIHPQDSQDPSILYVGRPNDFPQDYPEHFHIDAADGKTVIKVADTQK